MDASIWLLMRLTTRLTVLPRHETLQQGVEPVSGTAKPTRAGDGHFRGSGSSVQRG